MRPLETVAARSLAVAALVLSWRSGLWLFVGIGTAMTFVLVRHRVADHLWWRPIRVALLALNPRLVASERASGSDTTVPDIVVEARGRTTVLDQAGDLLRGGADLRRWAVGSERLALAHRFITETAPFVLPRRRQRSGWTLAILAVTTGVAAVAVASGGGGWAPIVYVAAFTATTAVLTDLREQRQWRPMLVASLAGDMPNEPFDGRTHLPSSQRLAETAGRPAVVRRAIRILDHSDLAVDQRSAAVGDLESAHRLLAHGSGSPRLARVVLHVPYLVVGWLTWLVTA